MTKATAIELPGEPVQVEITVYPLIAVIHRPQMIKEEVLRPLLEYARHVYSAEGPHGWQHCVTTMETFLWDRKKDLLIAAGIVTRIAAALRQHGYEVAINDKRGDGPQLDVAYFEKCAPGVRRLLKVVEKEPRGQIEVHGLDDAIDDMHFVAQAFPHAYIGIAVATKTIARRIRRSLAESLQRCIGLAYSGSRQRHTQVYVGTYGSLPAELDWRLKQKWDILFLPCADEATSVKVMDAFWLMCIPRTYAFINPQRRPDRLIQISLEQLAGPVIHRVGTRVVPVHVIFLPSPSETGVIVGEPMAVWAFGPMAVCPLGITISAEHVRLLSAAFRHRTAVILLPPERFRGSDVSEMERALSLAISGKCIRICLPSSVGFLERAKLLELVRNEAEAKGFELDLKKAE